MGNYINPADIDNFPSGTTEAEKAAIIEKMEKLVEKIADTIFYPSAFDLEQNGNNKNRLFLHLKAPILSVTGVWVCGQLMDPMWYAFDEYSVYYDCESSGAGPLDPESKYLLNEIEGYGLFPRGYNNIRVTGTYGEAVPEWVKQVIIILVKDHNDPTLYTHYMKSEKIGDYSYTKADELVYYTGIKEADDWLNIYIDRDPDLGVP